MVEANVVVIDVTRSTGYSRPNPNVTYEVNDCSVLVILQLLKCLTHLCAIR